MILYWIPNTFNILVFLCSLIFPFNIAYSYTGRFDFDKEIEIELSEYFPACLRHNIDECHKLMEEIIKEFNLDYRDFRLIIKNISLSSYNEKTALWLIGEIYNHKTLPKTYESLLEECFDITNCRIISLMAGSNLTRSQFERSIDVRNPYLKGREKDDLLDEYEKWERIQRWHSKDFLDCVQKNDCKEIIHDYKFDLEKLNAGYFELRILVSNIPSMTENNLKTVFKQIDKAYDKATSCNGASGKFHRNGGGFVANTASVEDTAYIHYDTVVCDQAQVRDIVKIYNSKISESAQVFEMALIEDSEVSGTSHVYGTSVILKSKIKEKTHVFGRALVKESSEVTGTSKISGNSEIVRTKISGNSTVSGYTRTYHNTLENAVVVDLVPAEYRTYKDGKVTMEEVFYDTTCRPSSKLYWENHMASNPLCFRLKVKRFDQQIKKDMKKHFGKGFNENSRILTISARDTYTIQLEKIWDIAALVIPVWKNTVAISHIKGLKGLKMHWTDCYGNGLNSQCRTVMTRWNQVLSAGNQLRLRLSPIVTFPSDISGVQVNQRMFYKIRSWEVVKK